MLRQKECRQKEPNSWELHGTPLALLAKRHRDDTGCLKLRMIRRVNLEVAQVLFGYTRRPEDRRQS